MHALYMQLGNTATIFLLQFVYAIMLKASIPE